jgi:hypothetical protein
MSLIDTILGRPLASSEAGEHRLIRTILYVNDGDWVQNRTAVVEEQDGTLQVLGWSDSYQNISVSESMSQVAS